MVFSLFKLPTPTLLCTFLAHGIAYCVFWEYWSNRRKFQRAPNRYACYVYLCLWTVSIAINCTPSNEQSFHLHASFTQPCKHMASTNLPLCSIIVSFLLRFSHKHKIISIISLLKTIFLGALFFLQILPQIFFHYFEEKLLKIVILGGTPLFLFLSCTFNSPHSGVHASNSTETTLVSITSKLCVASIRNPHLLSYLQHLTELMGLSSLKHCLNLASRMLTAMDFLLSNRLLLLKLFYAVVSSPHLCLNLECSRTKYLNHLSF